MIYRKFQDLQLSALGMGAMRLPVVDGNDAVIDEPAAVEMVDYAMAHGVNYYDTAWGYSACKKPSLKPPAPANISIKVGMCILRPLAWQVYCIISQGKNPGGGMVNT